MQRSIRDWVQQGNENNSTYNAASHLLDTYLPCDGLISNHIYLEKEFQIPLFCASHLADG